MLDVLAERILLEGNVILVDRFQRALPFGNPIFLIHLQVLEKLTWPVLPINFQFLHPGRRPEPDFLLKARGPERAAGADRAKNLASVFER